MPTQDDRSIQFLWERAAVEKKAEIARLGHDGVVLRCATYAELQQEMIKLRDVYLTKRSTKLFGRLESIIGYLTTFNSTISAFAQAYPPVTSLIWGSVQLIIDLASPLSRNLQTAVVMLEEVTSVMPRFEEYMKLYPARCRLQSALLQIYSGYLDFCIKVARFFTRGVVVHLWKSLILRRSLKAGLGPVREKIQRSTEQFLSEAQLAFVSDTASRLNGITQGSSTPRSVIPRLSITRPQNAKFLGREQELGQLFSSLSPHGSKQQRSCILHGMAGMGKTQTALEFCYQRRATFSYIFWIPSQNDTELAQAYSKIPYDAGTSTSRLSTDLMSDIEEAQSWLRRNSDWLLVFDNVDDPKLLVRYWPSCPHGSVLVTTQDRRLIHRGNPIHLKALSEEEGSRLLLHHLPEKETSDKVCTENLARRISQRVGGLPLLLVGLAGLVSDSCMSLYEILDELNNSWDKHDYVLSTSAMNHANFHYEKSVQMAFSLSLQRLPDIARSTLRIMSMLSPDGIAEDLISQGPEDQSLVFLGNRDKSWFISRVRTPLVTRHLIDFRRVQEQGESHIYYSLHRELQRTVLYAMHTDHPTFQWTFDQAVGLIKKVFPVVSKFMVPMHQEWPRYKKSIAHVMRLREVFESRSRSCQPLIGRLDFAGILTSAGYYLFEVRLVESGLALLSTAEHICDRLALIELTSLERSHGDPQYEANTDTLNSQTHPGLPVVEKMRTTIWQIAWSIIANSQGLPGRTRAMEHITKVLNQREQYIRLNHDSDESLCSRVLLANAYNDLACQLIDNGRYSDANNPLETSLNMKDNLAHEVHMPAFEYAESKKNLSIVRMAEGKGEEGLSLSREAVELLGEDDGRGGVRARFQFVYGTCLMNLGRLREALQVFEEVHKSRVLIFGKASMHTRNSLYAIALAQYYLGNSEAARSAVDDCLELIDEHQWPSECILRANYLQSQILDACGNKQAALEVATNVLTKLEKLLSTYSPELLGSRNFDSMTRVEQMVLLDHVVHFEAGRFSLHRWNSIVTHGLN
ncbi:hypothetical protein F5Y19DRAFT_445460 [Xylariaceae sp. FL1651]|nr:hypothetical protein F5Y19DRAFT_445460 [Xylariaceae sp. FL1651]